MDRSTISAQHGQRIQRSDTKRRRVRCSDRRRDAECHDPGLVDQVGAHVIERKAQLEDRVEPDAETPAQQVRQTEAVQLAQQRPDDSEQKGLAQ